MSSPREQDESRSLDPLGGGLVHNPFAALRPAGASQPAPSGEPPSAVPPGPAPLEGLGLLAGQIVVSLERKGHGGKSAVRIQGLNGDGAALKAIARELGRALGRGARREGDAVIVQGAELEGPLRWLKDQGAQRVVRGTR